MKKRGRLSHVALVFGTGDRREPSVPLTAYIVLDFPRLDGNGNVKLTAGSPSIEHLRREVEQLKDDLDQTLKQAEELFRQVTAPAASDTSAGK